MKFNFKQKVEAFLDNESSSAKTAKILLGVLFVAGVLMIAAMAPNIFQMFGSRYKAAKKINKKQFGRTLHYLKNKKFIEVTEKNNKNLAVQITPKGRERFLKYYLDTIKIKKTARWDGKWRMIIFDIPNKYTKARNAMRHKLKELGFYQLQKSVWICPYPCFEEIIFVAKVFATEQFIEFIETKKLLNDERLKRHFKII